MDKATENNLVVKEFRRTENTKFLVH